VSDESVKVLATFRRSTGEEIQQACEFPADEWRALERFVECAYRLAETRLLSRPDGVKFEISCDEQGVTRFRAEKVPAPDDFSAMLHRMRPFVLKSEATSVERIRGILGRRFRHPVFQSYLDRQWDVYEGKRYQSFAYVADGELLNSSTMLTRWLNTYEYHQDEDDYAYFEALKAEAAPWQFTEATYIAMMLDRARVVMALRQAVEALRRNVSIVPLPGDPEATF
jgi:hypothetical protein